MSAGSTTPRQLPQATLAVTVAVVLVIAGLTMLDRMLANAEEAEVRRSAERAYDAGLTHQHKGELDEAIESFRKAHVLQRRNVGYELALIEALIVVRKSDQADLLVHDALERVPNSGRANLLAARLMLQRGNTDAAISYYHRAIYGEWSTEVQANRLASRLELADLLAAKGRRDELMAELLPLQAEATGPEVHRRLASLFLAAGAAARARDEFRMLVEENPYDEAAQRGLGEAELQAGDFQAAHAAFRVAAAEKPGDAAIARRVDLSGSLLSLDPTPRKLASSEKYRRSLRLLAMAQADLQECAGPGAGGDAATVRVLAEADAAIAAEPPGSEINEHAEENLALVEQCWRTRQRLCGNAPTPEREALQRIAEKLSRF